MKRLTESSIAEVLGNLPSSADQAVAQREEEIVTTEAKQSSVELQARGKAQGTPGTVGYNFTAVANSNVALHESCNT